MKFNKDNIKLYNENLIHQKNYKLNAIKKYENNYKHIFNNIDLLQNIDTGDIETDLLNNKPKEYTLYLFNDFYTFYCEILELKKNFKEIIFDKIIEINNENAKKIKILENYNKYNQFVNVCFNSLNSYLEIISNYNAINIIDYKHNIYETFEINKTIETLNSYFNQTLKANNIKIENHFNKDLGFYTIDIYEPESQNNSNADTNTGEYKLTQKDRELLLSKKTKKNFLNSIITYQLEKYETISNIDKFNYFIDYCKKRDINKFTLQNLYYNKPKYSEITSKIKNENNELITLIQNIFKNAF